jgi:hypothetical protein
MVAVRRNRDNWRSFASDSTASSVDEFKAFLRDRKPAFTAFENSSSNIRSSVLKSTTRRRNSNQSSKKSPSLDASFYYEDRSEPVEETLCFTAREGAERSSREDAEKRDQVNIIVEDSVGSDSEDDQSASQSDAVVEDTHSISAHERDNNVATETSRGCSSLHRISVVDQVIDEYSPKPAQKSILRPPRGIFKKVDAKPFISKSHRSSVRTSSFRSSEAGSISATSQMSVLLPIARIRVTASDSESVSTKGQKLARGVPENTARQMPNGADAGKNSKKEAADDYNSNPLPSSGYGDEIADAGTELIPANGALHRREDPSEASSIILPGSYSSYSSRSGYNTASQDSFALNPLTKVHHELSHFEVVDGQSKLRHDIYQITTRSRSMESLDSKGNSRAKVKAHSAKRFKMSQNFKKGVRKSIKTMKYIVTGKFLMNGFFHLKQLGATLCKAIKQPFVRHRSLEVDNKHGHRALQNLNNFIDEELAHTLMEENQEDESSVRRASRYVATGRQLLNEAATLKERDPTSCAVLTRKAHTYAYVARQIAKQVLEERKAATSNKDMDIDPNLSREILHDEQGQEVSDENGKSHWKTKWEELQLFSFEDVLPSSFLCFSACGNCGAEKEQVLEVDKALDILAKLSEDEFQASKTFPSYNQSLISLNNVDSKTKHDDVSKSFLSSMNSTDVATSVDHYTHSAVSMERSRTTVIKDLVSELQSFYEAEQACNTNGTTVASTLQGDRSLFTKETTVPGGQSVELRTIAKNDTFDWTKMTASLFSAEEEDEGHDDHVDEERDDLDEKSAAQNDHAEEEEEEQYQSDLSYVYSESLNGDSTTYSQSLLTDGASLATGGGASFASSVDKSRFLTKQSKSTDHADSTTRSRSTAISHPLLESSSHSRSRFEKWSLRRKGAF